MKYIFSCRFFSLVFFLASCVICHSAPRIDADVAPADSVAESFHSDCDSIISVPGDSNAAVYPFSPQKVIIPAAVFAAGVTGTYLLGEFKNFIRDKFSWHKYGRKIKVDDYLQYSTVPAYIGIGFIPGVKSRCVFKERLMAGVTAYAVMAVAVNAMKYSFRHPRPGCGTRNSFPSGHTATVFTGAELMRIEYGNLIGIAGYAVGTAVGALRIYNDRHWITDVVAGAAIGVLSARVGYWLLPFERKLFHLDRKKNEDSSIALLPMIGDTNGLYFSLAF